jgi:D-arabinose 5-phosphate isomerase GutQ
MKTLFYLILVCYTNHPDVYGGRMGFLDVAGCGTSYYLPLTAAALYTKFTGETARGVPASEIMLFPNTLFAKDRHYLLIPISRRGKTPETIAATRYVKEVVKGGSLLITCTERSELSEDADLTLICPGAAEETKYMTKSFTSMLFGFQLLTAFKCGSKLFEEELAQLPQQGERIITHYQTLLEKMANTQAFSFWVILFAIIVIVYTMLGGMWSIVFTDALQFLMMMLGVLIVLPLSMHAVGWWPGLLAKVQPGHLDLITQSAKYNWKFVIAIWFLGIQWACLDQGLLQRAFSAKNTKVVVKGMVWSGIITTPFAFLWVTPGLVASVLYPGLEKPEFAIPMIIVRIVPVIILGLVVCGLLASQMDISTVTFVSGGVALFICPLVSFFN